MDHPPERVGRRGALPWVSSLHIGESPDSSLSMSLATSLSFANRRGLAPSPYPLPQQKVIGGEGKNCGEC
jgi:hypothetical protein